MIQPFITYRETDELQRLCYYIVQKEYPHLHCMISETPIKKIFNAIPISSYNLWIVFVGTLRGNFIPSYQDIDKEVVAIMQEMSLWFFNNRISTDLSRYKKWKVNDTSTSK